MMDERGSIENPKNYDTVYTKYEVDTLPKIEGGIDGFYERVRENRPPEDLFDPKEWKAIIFLIVSPEGEPTNVTVREAAYPAIGESVRSIVLNSSFIPGRLNGEAVPVALQLTVEITTTGT